MGSFAHSQCFRLSHPPPEWDALIVVALEDLHTEVDAISADVEAVRGTMDHIETSPVQSTE